MGEELQKAASQELQTTETQQAISLTIQKLNSIRSFVTASLKKGVDFDKIPGVKKDSLLQPGAEKVCLYLDVRPEYLITKTELGDGHAEYDATCALYSKKTGLPVGQGVGTLSTMDSNHRYRWMEGEEPSDEEKKDLKRQGLGKWQKWGEKWVWLTRYDTPNIWDERHKVLQMARKRAYVQATRNFAALSEYFTQDGDYIDTPEGNEPAVKPPIQEPRRKSESKPASEPERTVKVKGIVLDAKRKTKESGQAYISLTLTPTNKPKEKLFITAFDDRELPVGDSGTISSFDLLMDKAPGAMCEFEVVEKIAEKKTYHNLTRILAVGVLGWGEDGLPVYQVNEEWTETLDDETI